jgi:quercetin dioxygenase-like cupin family protein
MEPLNPSIQVVGPHQGTLGTLRILAGAVETRGHYFAFESETPPATSETPLDIHAHSAYDESEYVLSGTREITIEQQRWERGPGFFALAPHHARHGMRTIGATSSRWLHFFSPAGIEGYFRERERLRERGASPEELTALSVSYGAAAPSSDAPIEPPRVSDDNAPRDGRVLTTGAHTRQAYALCERTELATDVHVHPHQEEAFYVISGEITIESAGGTTTVPTGAFVLVPRGVRHRHIVSSGSMLLAVYSPGHRLPHLAEEPEA